jgi:hypothetical protein
MREAILAVVLLAGSPGNAGTAESSETIVAELAGSEGELPGGWEPLTFSKISRHTRYALVRESDSLVLRAESNASASGLVRTIDVDPKTHPRIRWRWKVENVLEGGDVTLPPVRARPLESGLPASSALPGRPPRLRGASDPVPDLHLGEPRSSGRGLRQPLHRPGQDDRLAEWNGARR